MAAVYASSSLNYGTSTNIRLVELLHNAPKDLIACRLRVVALDEPIQYTALSYVWGDPNLARQITLDGKPFLVRENLWQFLDQARQSYFKGLLWIDALSIDQANVQERNHQVAMMGKIYSKASLVAVWLGLGTEKMARAIRELWEIHNYQREPADWLYFARNVQDVCNAEYWRRVWIVQEFVLAHKVIIWCGMERLYDEALFWLYHIQLDMSRVSFAQNLPSTTYRDLVAHTLHSPALEILGCRISRSSNPRTMNFLALFEMSERLDCLDARDRVYALLSLVTPEERELLSIVPDYSKSAPEFYQELCAALRRRYAAEYDFQGRWLEYWLSKFQNMLGLPDEDEMVKKIHVECERGKQKIDVKQMIRLSQWNEPWSPLAYIPASPEDKPIPEIPESLLRAHRPRPSIEDLELELARVFSANKTDLMSC